MLASVRHQHPRRVDLRQAQSRLKTALRTSKAGRRIDADAEELMARSLDEDESNALDVRSGLDSGTIEEVPMQMRSYARISGLALVLLTAAAPALAQSTAQQTPPPATTTPVGSPATPARTSIARPARDDHVHGDTGLWFVPTGEVLPAKKWSLSALSRELRRGPGLHRRVELAGDVGIGLADRAEIFGAFDGGPPDRPRRPAGVRADAAGARAAWCNEYPFVRQGWSRQPARGLLDRREGQPASQWRQQPVALAVRGHGEAADGEDTTAGVGTGKADFALDAIAEQGDQPARRGVGLRRASSCAAIRTGSI